MDREKQMLLILEDWAVRALRHIAARMARVVGWIATRVPEDAPNECVVRVADGEQGRALALFHPDGGAAGSQVGGALILPDAPIAMGLAKCGVRPCPAPRDVQRGVTGSECPATWHTAHFVAAARLYRIPITIYRIGSKTQSIGVGSWSSNYRAGRIYLDMYSDGSHVKHYDDPPCDSLHEQWVDIGAEGEDWSIRVLRGLRNVHARSGAPRCACCGRTPALASGCSMNGGAGHRCERAGGCLAVATSERDTRGRRTSFG